MTKRKRANKEHLKRIVGQKRVEKEGFLDSLDKLEINSPSETSLHFGFNDSEIPEYIPCLTLFETSVYFKKATQIYTAWKVQNSWRGSTADERKTELFSLIANLLLLPRTSSEQQKLNLPLSLKVTETKRRQEVIQFFRENGYLNFLPGYSFTNGNSDTSKIYPTNKFDDIFPPLSNAYESNLHITFPDSGLVRIKRDGKRATLSETNKLRTKGLANKLSKINQINLSHKIVVRDSGSEYPCCTKLHAVFNRNLHRGGRIYASGYSYQNDLKENRPLIYIDDEPTIELDYSGLHPRMLYAEKDIKFKDNADLYDLAGFLPDYDQDQKLRQLSKLALLILINAKENKNIAGTLSNRVWEGDIELHHHLTKRYGTSLEGAGIYKRTVEAVIKKHSAISEFFYSDSGMRLQNRDGKMAVWICYSFAKQGIPILPVHDSFIVSEKNKQLLRDRMNEGYGKFNNGFSCPITEK